MSNRNKELEEKVRKKSRKASSAYAAWSLNFANIRNID